MSIEETLDRDKSNNGFSCFSKGSRRNTKEQNFASMIISELQIVQKLVNVLSQLLHGLKLRDSNADLEYLATASDGSNNGSNDALAAIASIPLSSASLDQLEADLRKRLHDVFAIVGQENLGKFRS